MAREFTAGDHGTQLTGQVNANLTGATVEAHIRKPDGTVLTRDVDVTDAAGGAWSYTWAAPGGEAELDQPGRWVVEIEVTYSNQAEETHGPQSFYVRPQIA